VARPSKDCPLETFSTQAVVLLTGKKSESQARKELDEAERSVVEVYNQLQQLAR
jgi:hypothetical protein